MRLSVEERSAPGWFTAALPIIAVAITFILTSAVLLASGANPLVAYRQFLVEPLSYRFGVMEVLVAATPLLFAGAAVAFAFRAGFWNIGAEGQLLCGAIAAAGIGTVVEGLPNAVALPLMMASGEWSPVRCGRCPLPCSGFGSASMRSLPHCFSIPLLFSWCRDFSTARGATRSAASRNRSGSRRARSSLSSWTAPEFIWVSCWRLS